MLRLLLGISAILLFYVSMAQVSIIPRPERYQQQKSRSSQGSDHGVANILRNLEEQNDAINKLLEGREMPHFFDHTLSYNISAGTVLSANLITFVASHNLDSPILVEVASDTILPMGTKFLCRGEEKNQRIHITCTRMVLEDKEHPVHVQLLNMDGTAGLKGLVHTGYDKEVLAQATELILKDIAKSQSTIVRKTVEEMANLIGEDSNGEKIILITPSPVMVYFGQSFGY